MKSIKKCTKIFVLAPDHHIYVPVNLNKFRSQKKKRWGNPKLVQSGLSID